MEELAKDFLGNPLEPGDTVVYSHKYSVGHQALKLAKVSKLTDKRIYLEPSEEGQRVQTWAVSTKVMKVTK